MCSFCCHNNGAPIQFAYITHVQIWSVVCFKLIQGSTGLGLRNCEEPGAVLLLTCLLAKMSRRASLSSFSVSSLANSLWASISLSLWQLSITNTTAVEQNRVRESVGNTHCRCVCVRVCAAGYPVCSGNSASTAASACVFLRHPRWWTSGFYTPQFPH